MAKARPSDRSGPASGARNDGAPTGDAERRGRGQRRLRTLNPMETLPNHLIPKEFRHGNKRLVSW